MSMPGGLEQLLATMPWLTIKRAPTPERGRYYPDHEAVLVRHGLRGAAYFRTVAHEAIHALRGHGPCASPALEARQEQLVERDAARLLIDIKALAEAAVMYRDDIERVAEELGVELETLQIRMRHLHPAERHYLIRRLAPEEESA